MTGSGGGSGSSPWCLHIIEIAKRDACCCCFCCCCRDSFPTYWKCLSSSVCLYLRQQAGRQMPAHRSLLAVDGDWSNNKSSWRKRRRGSPAVISLLPILSIDCHILTKTGENEMKREERGRRGCLFAARQIRLSFCYIADPIWHNALTIDCCCCCWFEWWLFCWCWCCCFSRSATVPPTNCRQMTVTLPARHPESG